MTTARCSPTPLKICSAGRESRWRRYGRTLGARGEGSETRTQTTDSDEKEACMLCCKCEIAAFGGESGGWWLSTRQVVAGVLRSQDLSAAAFQPRDPSGTSGRLSDQREWTDLLSVAVGMFGVGHTVGPKFHPKSSFGGVNCSLLLGGFAWRLGSPG